MGLAPALISLHYHVAKLRGAAGHAQYDAWAKNADRVAANETGRPFRSRILQRVLPLDSAVAGISNGYSKFVDEHEARLRKKYPASAAPISAHAADIRRMGAGPIGPVVTQIQALGAARGFNPRDTQREVNRCTMVRVQQTIAQAKLLEGLTAATRMSALRGTPMSWKRSGGDIQDHLQTILKATGDSPIPPPSPRTLSPNDALDEQDALNRAFGNSASFSAKLGNLGYEASGSVNSCGTSTATAKGSAAVTFGKLPTLTDPCDWSENLPETFKTTYETEDIRLAKVTDTPQPLSHSSGLSWEGNLFEVAALDLVASEYLTEFRNILNIKFSTPPDLPNAIRLDYSLYESLTSSVLGEQRQAGIDVDSGSVMGGFAVAAGTVSIEATKSIRFSSAAAYSDELNVLGLPWLTWWMSTLVAGVLAMA